MNDTELNLIAENFAKQVAEKVKESSGDPEIILDELVSSSEYVTKFVNALEINLACNTDAGMEYLEGFFLASTEEEINSIIALGEIISRALLFYEEIA